MLAFTLGTANFPLSPLRFPRCPARTAQDDYGWSEAGWHRNYSLGGVTVPYTDEVKTPNMDGTINDFDTICPPPPPPARSRLTTPLPSATACDLHCAARICALTGAVRAVLFGRCRVLPFIGTYLVLGPS